MPLWGVFIYGKMSTCLGELMLGIFTILLWLDLFVIDKSSTFGQSAIVTLDKEFRFTASSTMLLRF